MFAMLCCAKDRYCESCLCNITLRPSVKHNKIFNVPLKGAGHLLPPRLFFLSLPLDCTFNLNYCNLFSFESKMVVIWECRYFQLLPPPYL